LQKFGEAEADSLDAFDEVIERFGWTVRDLGVVPVRDFVEPAFQRSAQSLDLW